MGLNIGYLTSDKKDNELYSPYYIVDHIIKYLPKDKIIWLPFDEEWSAFYQRLKEKGYKIKVDKKKIDLKETIKVLGTQTIEIKLFEGVIGKLKVDVISE